MAIIDGRIYSKGQHLLIDGDSGKSSATLTVINVLPAKVILQGGDKNYVLGYPDQLGSRPDKARAESHRRRRRRRSMRAASSLCSRNC